MSRYRITFDTILRLTTEVGAADGKQAHFIAYCELAGILQNRSDVTEILASHGYTVDRMDPYKVHQSTVIQRKNDQ